MYIFYIQTALIISVDLIYKLICCDVFLLILLHLVCSVLKFIY